MIEVIAAGISNRDIGWGSRRELQPSFYVRFVDTVKESPSLVADMLIAGGNAEELIVWSLRDLTVLRA